MQHFPERLELRRSVVLYRRVRRDRRIRGHLAHIYRSAHLQRAHSPWDNVVLANWTQIFYTVIGILNLALAISIARETIIEAFEQSYRRRKHELGERRREHRRRRIAQHARRQAIEDQLRAAGLPVYVQKRRAAL